MRQLTQVVIDAQKSHARAVLIAYRLNGGHRGPLFIAADISLGEMKIDTLIAHMTHIGAA